MCHPFILCLGICMTQASQHYKSLGTILNIPYVVLLNISTYIYMSKYNHLVTCYLLVKWLLDNKCFYIILID